MVRPSVPGRDPSSDPMEKSVDPVGDAAVADTMTTAASANAAAVERMKKVYASGDFSQIEQVALDYYNDDSVETYPQSGEVFRGRKLIEAMNTSYAEATGTQPKFALREIRGRDDFWVVEGKVDYGNGTTVELVSIIELREGKLLRQTDYFASPFEAPEWRRPFREANK
jgi:hypothetical protein